MNINEVAGNTGEKGVEKGLLNGGKEEKQLWTVHTLAYEISIDFPMTPVETESTLWACFLADMKKMQFLC